jgi:hypothetical protein
MRISYKIVVGKPEGEYTTGRPRRRWKKGYLNGNLWTECIWFRIGISGRLLCIR